jgi:hypothetical protein
MFQQTKSTNILDMKDIKIALDKEQIIERIDLGNIGESASSS